MRVSIIIPFRNAENFLARSIRSALAAGSRVQGDWELLLIDNNSTDRSYTMAESYREEMPDRIRLAREPRTGAPAARNRGLAMATGTWIQYLDADDYLAPNKISRQLELADKETAWIIGPYRHVWPDGDTEDTFPHPDPWRGLFHGYATGHTISNLIRRNTLLSIDGWNEALKVNQDPDLHFRLLKAGAAFTLDDRVASYYVHHAGSRISSKYLTLGKQYHVTMLAAANAFLIENRPDYWQDNAPFFLGALLKDIRILASYDLESASSAYIAYFGEPNEWAIDRPYELVGKFTRLYPYLGFENVERLRLRLAPWVPEALKKILKA